MDQYLESCRSTNNIPILTPSASQSYPKYCLCSGQPLEVHWELIEKFRLAISRSSNKFRSHHASTPSPPQNLAEMADDTDAGLPVRQLLKMVASGDLSPAEFKKLTRLRRRGTRPHPRATGQSAETLYVIGAFLGCFAVNIPIYWQYLEGFEPILNINS